MENIKRNENCTYDLKHPYLYMQLMKASESKYIFSSFCRNNIQYFVNRELEDMHEVYKLADSNTRTAQPQ